MIRVEIRPIPRSDLPCPSSPPLSPRCTQVSFGLRLSGSIFKTTSPIRTRWPASLCVMHSGLLNTDGSLNAASFHDMRSAEHELVDMGKVALALDKSHPLRGSKKHPVKKGACAYKDCERPEGEPKRPQHRCGSCNDGHGAYYHLPCFFKVHRCLKL